MPRRTTTKVRPRVEQVGPTLWVVGSRSTVGVFYLVAVVVGDGWTGYTCTCPRFTKRAEGRTGASWCPHLEEVRAASGGAEA